MKAKEFYRKFDEGEDIPIATSVAPPIYSVGPCRIY